MSDELLSYFEQEYAALMQLAGDLPPNVARRLRLSRDGVSDPHVERLLEGVAYLGARVQARLDDEFPELTDGLLSILYPQLLASFPSSMMVQLTTEERQRLVTIEPHAAMHAVEKVDGVNCQFRTTSPVVLWPIEIEEVRLSGRPLPQLGPESPVTTNAAGVLKISLRCLDRNVTFEALAKTEKNGLGPLRLHLRGGPEARSLYELICGHTACVCFVGSQKGADGKPLIAYRGRDVISPGGFGPTDALIPWLAQGFAGFRLLLEYFALPEKFLCVDVDGIGGIASAGAGSELEILIYLDELPAELERVVDRANLALGCVPAINLFSRRCEPIDLDWSRTEYPVLPDRAMPRGMEVWSIEDVRETRLDGSSSEWRRLFRRGMSEADVEQPGYLPVVRPAANRIGGTETLLAVDVPGFDPATAPRSRLSVQALCTNRDLPSALPFGRGHPELKADKGLPGDVKIFPLSPPTPTLRPPPRGQRAWQLISHLSLSHLALAGGAAGAEALRDILRIYDLRNTAETRAAIAALVSVTAKDGTARLPGVRPGVFCRGLDVNLTFAPQAWRSGGLFLLSSVLEQFLRLHAMVNSFVRTTAMLQGHPDPVARWPARSGTRDLL